MTIPYWKITIHQRRYGMFGIELKKYQKRKENEMLKLQKQLQNSSRLNPFDWIQLKLWCTFKYSSENVSPFSMLVSLEFYIFLRTNSNVSIFPIKFDPNWQKAYLVFTLVQGLGQSIWRPLLPLAPVDSNRDCIAPIFYSFFYEIPNKPKTPMNFNCLFVSIWFDSIEFWSILFTFIVRFKVDKSLSFFYVLLFLCFFGVYINYIAFRRMWVWICFDYFRMDRLCFWQHSTHTDLSAEFNYQQYLHTRTRTRIQTSYSHHRFIIITGNTYLQRE